MISMSRSVAEKLSLSRSAASSTLDRIGIVLRRSTALWTWPRAFKSAARSIVSFIVLSALPRSRLLGAPHPDLEGTSDISGKAAPRKGGAYGGFAPPARCGSGARDARNLGSGVHRSARLVLVGGVRLGARRGRRRTLAGALGGDHHHGRTHDTAEQFVARLHGLHDAAAGHIFGRLLHHRLVQVGIELVAAGRIDLFQAVALEGRLQFLLGHLHAEDEVLHLSRL